MHRSVMLRQVLEWTAVRPGGRYIDATLGGGGHAEAILEASAPDGRLLGIDADPDAIARCRGRLARFGGRFDAAHARFGRLADIAGERGFGGADGVLMDLGVSSFQIDEPERGFSFRADGPLDMRMNPAEPLTAADLVNTLPEADLADLIRRHGEEPAARRIARRIVARRQTVPFRGTADLAAVIAAAAGRPGGRIHPATRTFQALRIAVNRELDELDDGLRGALDALRAGGRMTVISFHSLEDRTVKHFFRAHQPRSEALAEGGERWVNEAPPVRVLTRKPVEPDEAETAENPRARSARLRAAERTS
ncbi:MAG: 16S rRNA (cytosine(1402)-N(4))-methyltransferase [Verrucomicrobia bacterium A1]|nr:MAG: 16S rRNA (cytosine(1402)-N(4))-methyltransferase [Verrucomicrobia bacterium A1]